MSTLVPSKSGAFLQVSIMLLSTMAALVSLCPMAAATVDTVTLEDAQGNVLDVVTNGTIVIINVTDGSTSGPGVPKISANVFEVTTPSNNINVDVYDDGGLVWDTADDGIYVGTFNVSDSSSGGTTDDPMDFIAVADGKGIRVSVDLDSLSDPGTATVSSDFTAPTVSITSPDGSYTNGNYYLTITASDANMKNVTYQIDSGNPNPTQPGGGTFTATIDTTAISQDTHEIKVTARDNATNENYAWINVTVDRNIPAVTIHPTQLNVRDSFNLNVTVSDININESTIEYRVDSDTNVLLPKVASETFAEMVDISGKAEGEHTIFVTAGDLADNTNNSESTTFTIDRTMTAITINTKDGLVVRDNFILNATITDDNLATSEVKYKIDGGNSIILQYKGNDFFETTINTLPLDEGPHTISVVAKDLAGNLNESDPLNFVVDRTDPTITITSPTSGYFTTEYTIMADVVDVNLDANKVVYIKDAGSPLPMDKPASGETTYTKILDTSGWNEKRYDISIKATDMAGNFAEEGGISIIIDRTAPSISYSFVPQAGGYRVEVTITDPNLKTDSVLFSLDGGSQSEFDNIVSTTYSSVLSDSLFPEGVHNITVYATDLAGNQRVSSYTEDIADPPPKISGLVAIDQFDGNVKLTWAASTATDVDHYNVYYRAFDIFTDVLTMSPTETTKNNELSLTGLVVGTQYYFAVTAVDKTGNENKSSVFPISLKPKESIKIPTVIIKSMEIDNTAPREGDTVIVTVTIENTGDLDGTGLELRLRVDGMSENKVSIPSLAAGESLTKELEWAPYVGDHELKVEVSSLASVLDSADYSGGTITVKKTKSVTQNNNNLPIDPMVLIVIVIVVVVIILAAVGLRGSKKEDDELKKQEIELGLRADDLGRIHKPGEGTNMPAGPMDGPPGASAPHIKHSPDVNIPSSSLLTGANDGQWGQGQQPPPQQQAPPLQPPPQQQAPPPQPPPQQQAPPLQPPPQQQAPPLQPPPQQQAPPPQPPPQQQAPPLQPPPQPPNQHQKGRTP